MDLGIDCSTGHQWLVYFNQTYKLKYGIVSYLIIYISYFTIQRVNDSTSNAVIDAIPPSVIWIQAGSNARCNSVNLNQQAIDDPSSNQFRDPPTYTHQPSMQQKVPFSLIRCSSSKVAFCSCVEWGWHIYNIVESESDPLTRRAVDLFEKEPLKGNSEVHLHTPTKFGEDRSKDLGGDREQTDRQTNRQTDKRCSIYSMIKSSLKN